MPLHRRRRSDRRARGLTDPLKFGGTFFHLETGYGQGASADVPVATLVWQHWALTRSNGALQPYLDGAPNGWGQDSNFLLPFGIGVIGGDGYGDNLLGYLDELAVYDYALRPERIAAHAHP